MNLPAALFAIRWLIRDTFRQSRANGIFWLMLGVSGLCIAFCLTVGTHNLPLHEEDTVYLTPAEAQKLPKPKPGVAQDQYVVVEGKLLLAFGAVAVDWNSTRDSAVRYLQLVLLGLIADTGGILLALVWTAGFLPTFLEPGNAAVLLAKPVPRWSLLAGKYLGVVTFVAFQATVFVVGIWLALALRTGVWSARSWAALPVLLLHFTVFFSFSALLATTTRSTVACVFGSLVFWFICVALNLGRHWALTLPELAQLPGSFRTITEIGYWVLPKPADLGMFLTQALGAEKDFVAPFDVAALTARNAWHPGWSLLTSFLAALGLFGLATHELSTRDY